MDKRILRIKFTGSDPTGKLVTWEDAMDYSMFLLFVKTSLVYVVHNNVCYSYLCGMIGNINDDYDLSVKVTPILLNIV